MTEPQRTPNETPAPHDATIADRLDQALAELAAALRENVLLHAEIAVARAEVLRQLLRDNVEPSEVDPFTTGYLHAVHDAIDIVLPPDYR